MKLTDLRPQFIRHERRPGTWNRQKADGTVESVTGLQTFYPFVDHIEDAMGITFLCPKCFTANCGPIGTHTVICWSRSRGAPDDASPAPGRWKIEGTHYHDLTFNAEPPSGARSILLLNGCHWHGFITDGEVT